MDSDYVVGNRSLELVFGGPPNLYLSCLVQLNSFDHILRLLNVYLEVTDYPAHSDCMEDYDIASVAI